MSTDGWRNTMRHVCRIKYDWVTERRKCCDSEQCGWAFKTMLHWKHFIYMKRQESANLQTGYRLVVTPHGSAAKNPPVNAGDEGSIPGSGRSPGIRNGSALRYSCLRNPMDRRGWQATSPWHRKRVRHNWVTKQQKQLASATGILSMLIGGMQLGCWLA